MDELQEKVSKDFNEDIEILKQIKDKIKVCFGRDYISYVIYGEPCFHDAYNSSCNKKESECETLFEKIISRSVTISNLKYTIDIPLSMTDEIENAKMLWTIVRYDLLDLNIFWGMEFNREYAAQLPEEQQKAYDYFKYVANYYLDETQKYYELFLNCSEKNISNNFHDDRFSQADRIEIYKNVMQNPISTLAAPEQYARVPLEGMPDPIGEVYRDDIKEKKIEKFKRSIELAKKEIEKIVGIPYEEYDKLSIDEQHKLIEQKTGKKVKPDHRLYIDGIPMDDEHIIKMDEVDNYLSNLTKKVKRKVKNIFKK